MRPETIDGLNHKRQMVKQMVEMVEAELDRLPEDDRLALWLSGGAGLNQDAAADALSIPGPALRVHRDAGMRGLLHMLTKKGVFTDEASIVLLLGVMMSRPAPPSVLKKIRTIVDGVGQDAETPAIEMSRSRSGLRLVCFRRRTLSGLRRQAKRVGAGRKDV